MSPSYRFTGSGLYDKGHAILLGMEREKTSVAMTQPVRMKLKRLKLRLQEAGVPDSVASVSSIIEALVKDADFDTLLRYFERH